MFSSTFLLSALLILAPLADASLVHGSARHSRHNSRAIARRQSSSNSTASAGKCPKRSHKPAPVVASSSIVSLSSATIPTVSASSIPVATSSAIPTGKSKQQNASGSSASSKASPSSSSAAAPAKSSAASSSSSSSSGTLSGLLGALFPVSASQAWTTASGISGVDALKLTTSALSITSEIKQLSNPISTFQGKTAMEASFPSGCWGLEKDVLGGMSWYGAGQTSRSDWNNAKEVTFGYSIYFDDNFGWNKGGKLPGLYFGKSEEAARGCSGGNRDTECASVRLMWRKDGQAEFYTYLPNPEISSQFDANKVLCDVAPYSDCNDVYGASVGRGAFSFESGAWNDVAMRVLLNDEGKANGEIELFVNGQSKVNVGGLIIAASKDSTPVRAQGIMAQSFFGGSDSTWQSPKDQSIHFSDFSVAVTKTF